MHSISLQRLPTIGEEAVSHPGIKAMRELALYFFKNCKNQEKLSEFMRDIDQLGDYLQQKNWQKCAKKYDAIAAVFDVKYFPGTQVFETEIKKLENEIIGHLLKDLESSTSHGKILKKIKAESKEMCPINDTRPSPAAPLWVKLTPAKTPVTLLENETAIEAVLRYSSRILSDVEILDLCSEEMNRVTSTR